MFNLVSDFNLNFKRSTVAMNSFSVLSINMKELHRSEKQHPQKSRMKHTANDSDKPLA